MRVALVLSELLLKLVLLVSPVAGILTDPGPLCPGERVTLTCDASGGTAGTTLITWLFEVIAILPGLTTLPANQVVMGVDFSISLSPAELVSNISFVARDMVYGRTLRCVGNGEDESDTFQENMVSSELVNSSVSPNKADP